MGKVGSRDQTIRVMVVDDHPIVRQGLEVVLAAQQDLKLVASASDGTEAVEKALRTIPDVIIMDVRMPEKDGLTALQEIREIIPETRVLILTSFAEDDNVPRAIKAGAAGFLLKESTPEELIRSVREVAKDGVALHPTAARMLVREIKKPAGRIHGSDALTDRELEVLECLSRGLSNKEIAQELTISVRTVTTHVRNILDRLEVANRTQAALYAIEQGIVPARRAESNTVW